MNFKLLFPELNQGQIEMLKNYMLDIIGPNLDKDALVQKGDRQGAKEAMAINKHLEGIREKITGKPEVKDNRWWLKTSK